MGTDVGFCEVSRSAAGCCDRLCAVGLCGMERGAAKWCELLGSALGSCGVLGFAAGYCEVVFGGGVVCGVRRGGAGWQGLSAREGRGGRCSSWCMWRSQVDWLE